MTFVYISYSLPDREFAFALRGRLEIEGYTTWLEDSRQPDAQVRAIMRNAIAAAAVVVAAEPRAAARSELMRWEISVAQSIRIPIAAVGNEEDIATLLERLPAVAGKSDEQIALPTPLKDYDLPELPGSRPHLGRLGRVAIVLVAAGAALWLMQLFALSQDRNPRAPGAVELTEQALTLTASQPTAAPTHTLLPTVTSSPTPSPTTSATITPSPTATATATSSPSATQPIRPLRTPRPRATPSATVERPTQAASQSPWVTNTPPARGS